VSHQAKTIDRWFRALLLSLNLSSFLATTSPAPGGCQSVVAEAGAGASTWAQYNRSGDDALVNYFSQPGRDKAELRIAEQNYRQAVEQLRKGGKKDTRLAVSLRKLSAVLREQGKYEEARSALREYCATFRPICPHCKVNRGVIPIVRGRKALKDYELEVKNGEVLVVGLEQGSEEWHCKRCKSGFQPAVKLPSPAPGKGQRRPGKQ
jgi:hypothetical protein